MTVKILILGSCVSRDPFGHPPDLNSEFVVVDYYARTSLASLSAPSLKTEFDLSGISSSFQKKMVKRDFDKSFWGCLDVIDYDVILMDFVDDRFDLVTFAGGFIATNSSEFESAKLHLVDHGNIPAFSDAFFDIWLGGWEKLKSRLSAIGKMDTLLINKVYFAEKDDQGINFENTIFIDDGNKWLSKVYERLSHDIPNCQFIDYGFVDFVGQAAHRWGRSPFHYGIEVENICLCSVKKRQSSIIEKLTTNDGFNYGRWGSVIVDCQLADVDLSNIFKKNGIYRIFINGVSLDFLIDGLERSRDRPGKQVYLVSFNAAVTSRSENIAPFFSGLGIAASLNMPLIAVADPSVSLDNSLGLGWYAGNEAIPNLVQEISNLLDGFAKENSCDYLLFGGSGGGFAAISVLSQLQSTASALVWNPQTSIAKYNQDFSSAYILSGFPGVCEAHGLERGAFNEKNIKYALDSCGIVHDITKSIFSENKCLLYIQNRSDWHVASHAYPFMQGSRWIRLGPNSFGCEPRHATIWFGDWADGHATPPVELINDALLNLSSNIPTVDIVSNFDSKYKCSVPVTSFFVDGDLNVFDLRLNVSASFVEAEILIDCPVEWFSYAFYFLVNGIRVGVRWYEAIPCAKFSFEFGNKDKISVIGFVKDSLGCVVNKSFYF